MRRSIEPLGPFARTLLRRNIVLGVSLHQPSFVHPPVIAFHFDPHILPLPPGHRFPIGKYGLLRRRVEAAPGGIELRIGSPATEGELALAHEPGYIADVLGGTLSQVRQREIGFEWTPALAARSVWSVGATIAAARVALSGRPDAGVAASLGGGTHHADAGQGSGYCVFNDVAVAARLMQAEWHRRRRALLQVAVIDLDVHQGNGTAAIFAQDDTVFTLSMHGERNFPFRKSPSDLDVGLPDGCSDDAYLAALRPALDELWRRMQARPPGLVFYLAGADPHEGDRLGRLKLSAAGLAARDEIVLQALAARRIPAVVLMAGGYGHDITTTVDIHLQTLRIAERAQAAWAHAGAAAAASPTMGR
jgi:acetoin utilization deacetylase AcuC-like enzyme